MINKLKFPALLVILFLSISVGNAQQTKIPKSEITEVINGQTYYIHFVKQGQNLDAIAKTYKVSADHIRQANPNMGQQLVVNQIIKIPSNNEADKQHGQKVQEVFTNDHPKDDFSESKSAITHQEPAEKSAYITHTVKKKETFYGISRQYDVSINAIKEANPEIGGLQPGQNLKIPQKQRVESNSSETPEETEDMQESEKSIPQQDEKYHLVAKGESLYKISRKYRITADALIEKNNFLKNGMEPGQRLIIPQIKDLQDTLEQISKDQILHTRLHRVRRKETLYSISKAYNVDIERIFALNPDLEGGLEKRMKLKIPVKIKRHIPVYDPTPEQEDEIQEQPDIVKKKNRDDKYTEFEKQQRKYCESIRAGDYTYNVALMLPFYLDEVDSIKAMGSEDMLPPSAYKSFRFLQFYEGARLALDTLQQQGLKVRLFVYDVDEDTWKTRETISRPELDYMDLIIGPLYKKSFSIVSDFAQQRDIKIINPLTNRQEILSNDNVYKVQPSFTGQLAHLANFIQQRFPDANVMLIRQNPYIAEDEINLLKEVLVNRLKPSVMVDGSSLHQTLLAKSFSDTAFYRSGMVDGIYVEDRFYDRNTIESAVWDSIQIPNTVKQVTYSSDSITAIERKGSIARKNVVVALANDKAFVLDLITRLNVLRDTMNITLIGLPSWKDFDLEYEYLMNLDLHLFGPDYIEYDSPNAEAFIRKFRREYNTEPDPAKYAFVGYDIMDFFLRALMQYGVEFEQCLPYIDAKPIQVQFDFRKTRSGSYENTGTNFFRFDDYERIDLTPIIQKN